ncbi:deaminase domain-containing protein [Clostridium beijerinckii]|uniref:deaminase domain-containing protein n=1 Tax=Clostridium beijerinckii TaxID=1520 RepID=UPI000478EB80|nr:deaminase domain-containing protein [Clostridium beijerinckii]
MTKRNIISNKRKKERIKINNLSDFKDALKKEGYKINYFDEEKFKVEVAKTFKVDNNLVEAVYKCIGEEDITYRADNVRDLINYMKRIILFESEHNKLWKKISSIKILNINRVEYERESMPKDNVQDMISAIEEVKRSVSRIVSEEEKLKLEILEKELDNDYLYSKDIELLKKMILIKEGRVKESYNINTKVKTISIEMPKQINYQYITPQKGTVEYHQHISNSIPRMQRLIKNINKYMKVDEEERSVFKINQSKTLQDSINIAVAIYDNKEFKAISGSNDIADYCSAPEKDESFFKSNKVNKLGEFGIGYDRINDSEKKIIEEIHKQIEARLLKDEGNLILYSKWEPCPSCCFVISQFCKKHPNIKVQVKYHKKYGE